MLHRPLRLFGALVVLLTGLVAVSCTPEQIALFKANYRPPTTCHAAVDTYWPAASRSWAHAIVNRESGGDARAKNPSSTASGCFQLLAMHGWRIPGGWANRFNAAANVQGALSLYREAGTSPWRM